MNIVSSQFAIGVPQNDGRCYVVELHNDDSGQEYRIEYGPVDVAEVDCGQIMRARAAQIELDGNAPII